MNWVFGAAISEPTDHGRRVPPEPRLVDVDAGVGSIESTAESDQDLRAACVACVRGRGGG